MAVVRIMHPPVSTDVYDAVQERLGADTDPPTGLIVHTAGIVDGALQVVDVWESGEAADAFARDRLGPAIAAVAGDAPGEPPAPPTTYELHSLIVP